MNETENIKQISKSFNGSLLLKLLGFSGITNVKNITIRSIGIELAVFLTVLNEESKFDSTHPTQHKVIEKRNWVDIPVINITNRLNITLNKFHYYMIALENLQIIHFTYDEESLKYWYKISKDNEKTLIDLEISTEIERQKNIKDIHVKAIKDEYKSKHKNTLLNIKSYKSEIKWRTEKNYKKFFSIVNPNNLKRDKNNYHLDHIFSIQEGFDNKIDPKIISNPYNLQMLSARKNRIKRKNSWQTEKELYKGYAKFENGGI